MSNIHHPNKTFRQIRLIAGKRYAVKINLYDKHVDATCVLHWDEPNQPLMWDAIQLAAWADHIVLVMGLSSRLEGEEMRGLQLEGFEKGDRTTLDLPEVQQQLIKRIYRTGKPLTLVIMSGSALSLNWENENLPAILEAWYPGEQAGRAVADVLFGDYNPAGRLPLTFYKSVSDLPSFEDYNMEGKTYRYFHGEVLYPFGYGLSYSSFIYQNLIMDGDVLEGEDVLTVSVDISNTSAMDGEEVVQMYIRYPESALTHAIKDLRGFERIMIKSEQTRNVTFDLTKKDLAFYDEIAEEYVTTPGVYEILVGPSSDESKLLRASIEVR
jgi:beta-glucosidase